VATHMEVVGSRLSEPEHDVHVLAVVVQVVQLSAQGRNVLPLGGRYVPLGACVGGRHAPLLRPEFAGHEVQVEAVTLQVKQEDEQREHPAGVVDASA